MKNKNRRQYTVFAKYQAVITEVAGIMEQRFISLTSFGNAAAGDLKSLVLNEAADVLIDDKMSEKPDNEARAYLLHYYKLKMLNFARKEKRRTSGTCQASDCEAELQDDSQTFVESDAALSRMTVHAVLQKAPEDVRALCEVFMRRGSFDAALSELGWSKGKVYRTKQAAEAFFRKNCISCGGFFEPVDICR